MIFFSFYFFLFVCFFPEGNEPYECETKQYYIGHMPTLREADTL